MLLRYTVRSRFICRKACLTIGLFILNFGAMANNIIKLGSGSLSSYPARTTVVVADGATVSVPIGPSVTMGENSRLILGSGSTLDIEGTLEMKDGSVLDAEKGAVKLQGELKLEANSTLCLRDYPVSGNGTIAAPEYTIRSRDQEYASLVAPCTFIFNGVSVTGMWHIDRAYPQWFAAPGCDDWSDPINKAIEMKYTGEVFLQRGRYKVKKSVKINYGIELVGESGAPRFFDKNENYRSDFWDTSLFVSNSDAALTNFQSGYMVLVNTKGVADYPNPNIPIRNQFGMWRVNNPCNVTALRNITLMDGENDEQVLPGLSALFAAGGLTIEYCGFRNFKQAIVKSRDYADGFVIRNCRFSGANKQHYENIVQPDSDGIYDTEYMVHLAGDGDNLQIVGNSFSGGYIKRNSTLFVANNRGGTISDNITGGIIKFADCRGLSFVNNHAKSSMESGEGMQIQVLNSQMEISDNFFYKSELGNIVVGSEYMNVPCELELHNNTYLMPFHNLFAGLSIDSIANKSLEKREGEFQSWSAGLLARASAPEITIGYGATINMSNQFRQIALRNSTHPALTSGVQFSTELTLNNPMQSDVEKRKLNDLSPFLSGTGTINAGFSVNNISYTLSNINSRTAYMMANSADRWYAKTGAYEYYAIFVIDRQRNIVAFMDDKPYKKLNIYGTSGTSINKENFIYNPRSTNAVSSLVCIVGGVVKQPWSGYLRMYRCCTDTTGAKTWSTVDVPVANALTLYDNGLFLGGYPWVDCQDPSQNLTVADYLKIQKVSHINESVECYGETRPLALPSSWSAGDKLFNIGADSSWSIFLKK